MDKLTRQQWYELDEQMSHTPPEWDPDGVPGEHMKLIALLNRFGYDPVTKQQAMKIAEALLSEGWLEENEKGVSTDTP
jgi:hypothetical protein